MSGAAGSTEKAHRNLPRLVNEHRALLMLVALCTYLGAFAPNFLSIHNLTTILKGASLNAIAAIGFTLILILGQLDLSIGAVVMLCGMLVIGLQPSLGWAGAFAASLGAGALGGLAGCENTTTPQATGGGSGEGGLLAPGDILDGEDGENWARSNLLLDTVEDMELIGPRVTPTDLLVRLFHEEGPRVFDAQSVHFGCSCSSERVRESLSIYSAKDIRHMTTEAGIVTADCQFCGAHYEFDPSELGTGAERPGD